MYAVGMLGSYLSQGVYAVAGPFQPFGGAVDIIVVQQEDGDFKSSPWYVKFGDFQGVLKRQEKIVDISVNDAPADFHMILDSTGEAYFEKDVEPDEGTCSVLPDGSSSLSRQEGDIEIVVSTDGADVQSHEDEGSGSTASYNSLDSSIVGIAEVKIVTREEPRETDHQEQGTQASDGSHMEREHDKETNQVISETRSPEITDSIKDNCALDAPCPVNLCDRKSVIKSQEMGWDAKNQVNMLHNGHLQSTDKADLKIDAVPDTDLLLTETARTVNTFSDLEEVLPSRAPVILDRVNEDSLIGNEENMTNKTAVFSMEESKLQNVLTFLHAEAAVEHTSCSEPRVDDDPSATETSEFLANLGGNDHCNNVSDIDIGLDEDDMLTSIELFTAEEQGEKLIYLSNNGMKFDVPNDCREDRDSLAWDLESSIKQGLDDDVFLHSQTNSPLTEDNLCDADGESRPLEKEEIVDSNILCDTGSAATLASVSSPFKWRIWHLLLRWSRIEKTSPLSNQNLLAAASVAMKPSFTEGPLEKHGLLKWQQKTKLRTYVPTSAQLASLNLENGPNKVTFTFSSVIGKTQVDARIYLWKWNTKIVVSDVDGTITKSDVLGQVMPLVGRDWSQYGVTRLFSAIKDNGYEVLFLSARAISQACLTRRFLLNLKQDGETLPEGPVFISPDGLIPSLYREVIRRAPHEFKISCLEGIREVFPKNVNPFYAGFGNRDTDKISYLKVGIPEGKIFIINPKGEVMVNRRVEFKSYTSLYALVDKMFPPMFSHEQEEYNEWNFWKMALPDIDDELNTTSSRIVKSVGSTKK